jgi:AAA domain
VSSKASLLTALETVIRERHARGEITALVIDEAQTLSKEIFEEVRLLANIETPMQKLLPLVLAGQPELAERLNDQSLRQLKQRIALRCALRPLSPQETAAYIAGRIRAAGGTGAKVFTREAVALIHERSGGIPRTISVISDNALVGGFAAGQRPVGSELVREICRDFDLSPQSAAMSRMVSPPPDEIMAPIQPRVEDEAVSGGDGARPATAATPEQSLLDLEHRLRYAPQSTTRAARSGSQSVAGAAGARRKLLSFFRS